jgi:phosphoglycolate phosphatase
MRYKNYICDLDGTLLNTIDDLREAVNFALRENRLPLRTHAEVLSFVGNGIRLLIERAMPSDGDKHPKFDAVFDSFRAYYAIHCEDKTAPYDGILEMLRALKEDGCKIAVVSNKVDSAVQKLMPVYFGDLIDVAVGENEAAGIRKKPAPDAVFYAMERLGATKEDSVFIGDSEVDYQTAVNAGLPCISVLWGFRTREFLEGYGASDFVTDPDEIVRRQTQ